jgi:hypothetical protein
MSMLMLRHPMGVRQALSFTLQFALATEGLFEDAISRSTGSLADHFRHHLEEERGHAEWLAEDLDGFTMPLDSLAVAMAGSQYYLIRHVHPALLMGYTLALECPMPMEVVEELEAIHGKRLLRTLRHHAQEDGRHRQETLVEVAKQPADIQHAIEQNRRQTLRYVEGFYADAQPKES